MLRVTFVLDFGVPQISIEVDGIQIQARLIEDFGGSPNATANDRRLNARSSLPSRSPINEDNLSNAALNDDEHVPTVDELAESFIRTEPIQEIRELEQELGGQSSHLQESFASSDDGDDEGSAGMGAALALPTYFRNILNTALDRLSIVVNNIDIEMEDDLTQQTIDAARSGQSSHASLNFHIERIAIDSVTSQDVRVQIESSRLVPDFDKNSGKRRLRVENICARLVSDAENFVSVSRLSRPASPATARSEGSANQDTTSEPSISHTPVQYIQETGPALEEDGEPNVMTSRGPSSLQASVASIHERSSSPLPMEFSPEIPALATSQEVPELAPPHEMSILASSVRTIDEDRFADATSDDDPNEMFENGLTMSRHSGPAQDLGGSSILYDDEGLLEYAMQNSLLDSRFDDAPIMEASTNDPVAWERDGVQTSHQSYVSESASEASIYELPTVSALGKSFQPPRGIESPAQSTYSELPTVSALGRSFNPPSTIVSPSQSMQSENLKHSTDNLAAAQHHAEDTQVNPVAISQSSLSPLLPEENLEENLEESRLFTHDDAESMYMSAISAVPTDSTHQQHIPGGWDSSSTSSRDTGSDRSRSIPDEMISESILEPLPEVDDGYETPRPGSRQTSASSPGMARVPTPTQHIETLRKYAKLFLSIDEITIWFPLGLNEASGQGQANVPTTGTPDLSFKPPNLGEDSIFAEMPGSFSNYAQSSSHRRNPSLEESTRSYMPLKNDPPATPPPAKSTTSIDVEIGSIAGHMDLSTGRIMLSMVHRLLQALTNEPNSPVLTPKKNATLEESATSLEISIKHVGMSWVENVLAESLLEGRSPSRPLEISPVEAILRVRLSGLHLACRNNSGGIRAKLQVGGFVLASLNQDVISFQSSRPGSNRSVSTLPEQLKNDIEIDYEKGRDTRITVVTRPVKVMFDVQKLDDALSSFGGFSGVLELSSSMSSINTVQSPVMSPERPRPRGVHFGDGLPPPVKAPPPSTNGPKIQVQFGEVSFTLKGKACAVQLQTTSVRVAVRGGNVRLKVSEIQLLGPYVHADQTGTPLVVEVRGTTVNFLFAPEETDLARLISMITPSKDPYENNDDILIDTLLRQRRKGSVLRVEVGEVGLRISDLQQMKSFEALGAELARLSKVTKYLPDDDRPGLLTLAAVKNLDARISVNEKLGEVSISLESLAMTHVGVPALLAAEIGKATICRDDEILVHEVIVTKSPDQLPAIMVRMVGDEMEPIAKAKLFNLCIEYHVSTVMAALGISEAGTADDIVLGIASSVATITGASPPQNLSRQSSQASSPSTAAAKPLQIDLLLRNCAIGLNPRKVSSKGLFVLTEAHIAGKQVKNDYSIVLELRKASMHAIDQVSRLEEDSEANLPSHFTTSNRQLQELNELGYVSLSSISAAQILVNITGEGKDTPQLVDVEFKNELFVLESCADSTQTLISILNGLQPPLPQSTAEQYRTVVPLQEMMESFTGDAFAPDDDFEKDDFMRNADLVEDEVPTNLEFVGSFYNSQSLPTDEDLGDSLLGEDDLEALATPPITRQRGDRALLESFQEKYEITEGEPEFDFNDNYFVESDSERKGKAKKWDSAKNQYHLSNEFKSPDAPLKVRVRDVNIIWNLYDGYDWPRTRSIISQAVDDVEARAEERRRQARDDDDDDDFVEEDFLFNSVWIGVPVKDEKGALARRINHDIDDLVSETGSYATSTATRSTGATARPRSAIKSRRRLKLERSKQKKIAFSLMGVAVDLIVFPPGTGETISSVDVRVRDVEVFDHIPASTWRKFMTCAIDPKLRELNRPMINLELVTVKPVTDLAASELVIKVRHGNHRCMSTLTNVQVTVLPLRLHVDQDALDFITRFFEFKDDTAAPPPASADQPFIQRLEVMAVTMKLDYKPKRVDYRGLRSGHTTEFMNFLILDGSDITLRHAIVYGITSFDKLHKTLNDVWTPDVKNNQLPGVLSGLAAVRPLVNVGSGIRDLVVVPMREYKKDGRIVRSLQKGVYAFAKNTTSEVARLGAKVAIGTQTLLEGAEGFLAPQTASSSRQNVDWDGEDPSSDTEEPRAVSNYANQPIGVRAGLRSAARHLERDLLTARDAVIAIPAEVMEQGSGVGMARALARHAPTVILRPALGATKALSNALLGVGNALDEGSRRKIEDVSATAPSSAIDAMLIPI